eukprot:scaffold185464_cov19-Tisochrysis_lutea.AAC.1
MTLTSGKPSSFVRWGCCMMSPSKAFCTRVSGLFISLVDPKAGIAHGAFAMGARLVGALGTEEGTGVLAAGGDCTLCA